MEKEWTVLEVAGKPTMASARPTLFFSKDGRLSGSTSCNRFIGTFTVQDGNLRIAQAGTTLTACAPAVQEQELRDLDVPKGVTWFQIDPAGQLVLGRGDRVVAKAS